MAWRLVACFFVALAAIPDFRQRNCVLGAPTISLPGFSINAVSPPLFTPGFLLTPSDVAFLRNGSFLVAEKRGVVKYLMPDASAPTGFSIAPTFVLDIRDLVDATGDRGLNSIAIDANTFDRDPWLYLFYVLKNGTGGIENNSIMRISRVPLANMIADRSGEYIVLGKVNVQSCTNADVASPPLDCIPIDSVTHSACQVRVLSDGTLWATVGDGSEYTRVDRLALRSMHLDSYLGKLLRFDRDGRGLPSNPFFNGDPYAVRSKVFALGLRNPFRSTEVPGSNGSAFLVGNVGWNVREGVYRLTRGDNGGWPCYEQSVVNRPYSNLPECVALYAGVINGTLTTPFYDYDHGKTAAVMGGAITSGRAYGRQWANVFWIMDYAQNRFGYIRLNNRNDWSTMPNYTDVGTFANPIGIHHNPFDDKLYVLTVWSGSRLYRIDYGEPVATPAPTPISSPTDTSPVFIRFMTPPTGASYSVGDTIFWSLVATDIQGRQVDKSLLTVTVYLHHCPVDMGSCHLHEFYEPLTGADSGSLMFPDHDDNSFIEIQCSAGEPERGQASTFVYAKTVKFVTDSCIDGLPMTYSAYTGAAPYTHPDAVIGGVRTVSIPPQYYDGVSNRNYTFLAWSDCSTSSTNDFTIPRFNSTAIAVYA